MSWPKGKPRGPQSPEHRAKIGAAVAGKPHTQETKDRIGASVKASWAARRNVPEVTDV